MEFIPDIIRSHYSGGSPRDTIQTEAIYPSGRQHSILVVMMPRDPNPLGTIFGGVIMSHIYVAADIECHCYHPGLIVTVAMGPAHRP